MNWTLALFWFVAGATAGAIVMFVIAEPTMGRMEEAEIERCAQCYAAAEAEERQAVNS